MSSTRGIQNLLVNVFRPVYVYDPASATTLFTPRLEMSNIDTYSGNTMSVYTLAIGDTAGNVYIGSNAGNTYTQIKSCSNVTAVGFGAGSNISNVSNSVYLGYYTGAGSANASNVIAIGATANGNGVSNIYIGNGTGSIGSSNIFIGHGIAPGTVSNSLRIGSSNIYGNLSNGWVGINKSTPGISTNRLDVSGDTQITGNVGINSVPGTATLYVNGNFEVDDGFGSIRYDGAVSNNQFFVQGTTRLNGNVGINDVVLPDYSLLVSGPFRVEDSGEVLDSSGGLTTSTKGFASSRGTSTVVGGSTVIGSLQQGTVLVSALDISDSANRAARMMLAYTASGNYFADEVGSNIGNGVASIIIAANGDIEISDPSGNTYGWSITYFPIP